jgi:hypothetical protein
MTDSIFHPWRTRTEKRFRLTTVSSHFFKNLLLWEIFSYLALLKSYHRMEINIFNIYDSALFKNIF